MPTDRQAHHDAMTAVVRVLRRWEAPNPDVLAAELVAAIEGHVRLVPQPRAADDRDDWRVRQPADPATTSRGAAAARAALRRKGDPTP